MKFQRKRMCGPCPFKPTSLPGWLGAYATEEFIDCVRTETPLPCHGEVNYADPDWREKLDNCNHCVGSLIFTRKSAKLPRDPEWAAAVSAVDTSPPILFPRQAFIDYHSKGNPNDRRNTDASTDAERL